MSKLREMVKRIIKEERLVGKFFLDKRKNKPFRIISVDPTDRNGNKFKDKRCDVGIQYYDSNTKKEVGDIETIDQSELDYKVSSGQWAEYKQDFFG